MTRRRRYDFSQDETWQRIKEDAEHLKKIKKEREQFLKNIESEYIETVDETTGEVLRVYAPPLTETEGVRISFNQEAQ